jgi:hypothetical protein
MGREKRVILRATLAEGNLELRRVVLRFGWMLAAVACIAVSFPRN